jgi:hypothetical protein
VPNPTKSKTRCRLDASHLTGEDRDFLGRLGDRARAVTASIRLAQCSAHRAELLEIYYSLGQEQGELSEAAPSERRPDLRSSRTNVAALNPPTLATPLMPPASATDSSKAHPFDPVASVRPAAVDRSRRRTALDLINARREQILSFGQPGPPPAPIPTGYGE